MDFHTYTTMRDWTRRADPHDRPAQDIDLFYKRAIADAQKMGSGQVFGQMLNERDWEKARWPYYNLWPSESEVIVCRVNGTIVSWVKRSDQSQHPT